MIESVVRERQQARMALSISGLSSWEKAALHTRSGNSKGGARLCGERGDGCRLDMPEYSLPGGLKHGLSERLGGADPNFSVPMMPHLDGRNETNN